MPMNKVKKGSNMYQFITHTWNPIRGKCPHDCSYCYMKRIPNVGELRFVEKEMNTNLGEGNKIFVGSSCDMWVKQIIVYDNFWVEDSIAHCRKYLENFYVFQTKRPSSYSLYFSLLKSLHEESKGVLLGSTIETNKEYIIWKLKNKLKTPLKLSNAPSPYFRMLAMSRKSSIPKFISIEPIVDFDLEELVDWMRKISPKFISIGADSGNNNLPEPPAWKVKKLIEELKKFTEVKIKDNLNRILEGKCQ